MPQRPVLLCAPPWRIPSNGALAIATLRALLERAGLACEELDGALLFPAGAPRPLFEEFSVWMFAAAFDRSIDRREHAEALVAQHIRDATFGGIITYAADEAHVARLVASAMEDMARAEACIDACVDAVLAIDPDVVGFSATFESQIPAALAIARGVKARRPDVRVALGGAACFEVQGVGLAASFPDLLDAVCHTEGDDVIVPLVRALRGELRLVDVPGIAWCEAGVTRHTEPPPLRQDLDALPIPEYTSWLAAYARSPWAKFHAPKLFFESSRGCWWGQKHLCSFCGLNAEGLAFRAKSPDRVVAEIEQLWRRHPEVSFLQATDNILDMGYLKSVLPRLAPLAADPVRPLRMFFEIKSNLRKDQVRTLVAGGIVEAQPGIESLSDEVLSLMDKGASGLGQIQFIKWSAEQHLTLAYNLIINSPNEQAAWYDAMLELIPAIEHLPPPTGVLAVRLDRFSPYHRDPARYGIRDMRPATYYRRLYPEASVDLARIAYSFDYEHDQHDDRALRAAHARFIARVVQWYKGYRPGRVWYEALPASVVVRDRRGEATRVHALTGAAAKLWHELDRARPRRSFGTELDADVVDAAVETWRHRRWVVRSGDRYLAVIPEREGPSAAQARSGRAVHAEPVPA